MNRSTFRIFSAKGLMSIFLCLSILLSSLLLMSLSRINGLNATVFGLSDWIKVHHSLFLVWHLLIFLAIFYGFSKKVDRDARQYSLSRDEVKKAKRWRFALIGFVMAMDLLVHLF